MRVDLNNTVVENLTKEMGAKIITLFAKAGYKVDYQKGNSCKQDGKRHIFYGVVNGIFDNWSRPGVDSRVKIITLEELKALVEPELKFPRMMLVKSEELEKWKERLVVAIFTDKEFGVIAVVGGGEQALLDGRCSTSFLSHRYAKELGPEEITLKALNEKYNTNYKIIAE